MTQQEALFNYTLRLGDSALILSHRLSEWCSKGPFLEEDIALSNIALDLVGRANALITYAAQIEGKGRTEDDLAFKRQERHFHNFLITELPNGDFGLTIARQFLVATFELFYFDALSKSADTTLGGIAAKTLKEVRYHYRHAHDWVLRLGDGTQESHDRIQKSFHDIWTYTGEFFETDEADELLVKAGIAVDVKAIQPLWEKQVAEVLSEATLEQPANGYMQTGSRKGLHTEYLGFILTEMQFLPRTYPDAKW
jgi:ring-1,2-phenylacetyl-CoA epoxidase subunit PaaC